MRPLFTLTIWILLCFVANDAFARVPVFVSIAPQKTFVQHIGKDLVEIRVMVQPGATPHTYEPKPRQMVAIAKTTLYFAIGVEFERVWLKKIIATNPQIKVIHTDQGIKKLSMRTHLHQSEEDNHKISQQDEDILANVAKRDPDHPAHQGLDPHIWLSPPLAKIQAHTILIALKRADPANANEYQANFQQFISKLDLLHNRLKTLFTGKQGLSFMVFHPAWGYFAQTYGLTQVPIEIEGKRPKPAQLQDLIKHARANGIRIIFAQPQLSTKSARLVAKAIGGQVALVDPLAENWIANLKTIAEKFNAVLK